MKRIRKVELCSRQGQSLVIYEVGLYRLSQGRYVVNFRHGQKGTVLREGTRTVSPVDQRQAEEIFNSIVVAKMNKGYVQTAEQVEDDDNNQTLTHPKAATSQKNRQVHIEADVLKRFQNAQQQADENKIRRAVWRIGELGLASAVPDVMALIPAQDDMLNYCAAFALGRCADPQAYSVLNRLLAETRSDAVRRIAVEALLATASKDRQGKMIDAIVHQMPESIQTALSSGDVHHLAAEAGKIVYKGGPDGMMLLEALYQVSLAYRSAWRFVYSAINDMPFKPNYFKALRHIYKVAEFRLDAEVMARLSLRFETEPAYFHRFSGSHHAILPGTWKALNVSDEVIRPNSRLAFSNRTRDYFRKRAWRMLRRMGDSQDPRYVLVATQILLAITDAHAVAPKRVERSRWERGADGRWHSVQEPAREYGPFAGFVVFNHILHGNSSRHRLSPSSLTWLTITETDTTASRNSKSEWPAREEAYPELWDRQPEALLALLTNSRCEPVHQFAVRALMDNDTFCQTLSANQIIPLLVQPYVMTLKLALRLAEKIYDPASPNLDLTGALLNADLVEARAVARQWIETQPTQFVQATAFMTNVLTSRHVEVRQWGRELLKRFPLTDAQIQSQIARIVAYLMGLDQPSDSLAAIIGEMDHLLLREWAGHSCKIDIAVITDLLDHKLDDVKIMAAKLVLQHEMPPDQLPSDLMRSLIESRIPEIQGLGVQLFAGLPVQFLLGQFDLIFTFCSSPDFQVRRAVQALVQRLAQQDTTFGRNLFDRLFPLLFRKPPSPEFHQDLVALFTTALEKYALALDSPTIWRLLQARAAGARQLGGYLLTRMDPRSFSIRQWAVLGSHALLTIRQWSWQTFQTHIAAVADAMQDALRLLDSDWDDTRNFALGYFRKNFKADNWTPALLIAVCDSVRPDVQQFGRELITTFFNASDGPEYLLKLSQHPSRNVQLFTSNFLETHASGDPKRIAQLTPYFITVLSQVNSGRVVKTRILNFLHTVALESAEAAALIAPICNRISATVAIGDRGTCIQILCDIKRRYPQIPTVLVSVPMPTRPTRSLEG